MSSVSLEGKRSRNQMGRSGESMLSFRRGDLWLAAAAAAGFTVYRTTCPKWLLWALNISPVAYAMEAITAA